MTKTKVVRSLRIEKKMTITNHPQIAPHPYLSLQAGGESVRFGLWTATATELVDKDWKYYAKSYKYPKVTISDRQVTFVSDGGKHVVVDIGGWRGNWRLHALVAAKIFKPRTGLLQIRLNPVFDLELLGTRLEHKFYRRLLKGEPVDYCIVSPAGITYHADSIPGCIRGLRLKQADFERRKTAVVDWRLLRNLGFCREGILEFCQVFGFDPKGSVTPTEVYDRIRATPSAAEPYLSELKKLAEAVCFEVPEFI